jgi:hypothetical protein
MAGNFSSVNDCGYMESENVSRNLGEKKKKKN